MKTLACSDMGLTCPFVAQGENDEELVDQLAKHGDETHPKEVEVMKAEHSNEELRAIMASKIKEA